MNFKRHTPYFHKHAALNAEFVDRFGYAAALHFGSIEREHIATRNAVGLFDVYSQYLIEVTGPDAARLLQHLAVNDIDRVPLMGAVYTSLCNETGGMLDDLIMYRLAEDVFRLAPTPSRLLAVEQWLRGHGKGMRATIVNYGPRFAYMSVQGPNSRALLSRIADADLSPGALKYFRFTFGSVAGVPDVMISRTGYSGELGYELFYSAEYAEHMWDSLVEAGADLGVTPCGLGALATLRMEKNFPLYGLDLSPDNSPVEAGLEWTIRLDKPAFMGRDTVSKQMEQGPARRLVLISLDDMAANIAIGNAVIANGRTIGSATSVAKGHTVRKALAQAYVEAEFASEGQRVTVQTAGIALPGLLHTAALYDPRRERVRS